MRKTNLLTWWIGCLWLTISHVTFAQSVAINSSGASANASAILDVNAAPNYNQGLLIPRMSDAQRKVLQNPVAGLLIFNTTSNTLNIYNGSGWQNLPGSVVSSTAGAGIGPGNGFAINTTGNAPDASALLDIASTGKGLLIPRTTQGSVTVTTGLVIYNTSTNALNVYNGSAWTAPCYSLIDNTTGSGAVASGMAINTTGALPNASAILDISSTNTGLLFPSMTATQRNAVPSPAQGLLIYCSTDGALEYWNGSNWMALYTTASTAGAVASPNPMCMGSSLSLAGSATNATGWLWAGPGGFSSNSQNPTVSNFSYVEQGTYTLTVSNGCGSIAPVTTSSVTANTSYLVITLTNNQSTATTTGFQQMITVNSSTYNIYENAGLQNIEFSTGAGATGTKLNAWIESGDSNTSTNTIYWVNLGTNTIAKNGGTLKIYMNFMPTNLLSASGPTGEAPELSATYGQYDNGSMVFSFYDDFKGTSLNPSNNWSASNLTYSVNNGFKSTATSGDGYIVSKNVAINPASKIVDFYGNLFINSNALNWVCVGAVDGGESASTTAYGMGDMIVGSYPVGSQVNGWQRLSLTGLTNTNAMQSVSGNEVWTVTPLTSSSSAFYMNYGGVQTVSGNADTYPLYEGLISAGANHLPYTFSSPLSITWYRVRIYPPSNVMPSVSLGSMSCY